jgi:hypothetical protein
MQEAIQAVLARVAANKSGFSLVREDEFGVALALEMRSEDSDLALLPRANVNDVCEVADEAAQVFCARARLCDSYVDSVRRGILRGIVEVLPSFNRSLYLEAA